MAEDKDEAEVQKEDMLSSLPNDILISILTRIPLGLAIATCSLAPRLRDLWKSVTSIHVTRHHPECLNKFNTDFEPILMQISSPFIHCFSLEFVTQTPNPGLGRSDFSWLRKICDRNIHELKLVLPYSSWGCGGEWPCFIFQTQSLVLIELSDFGWSLPTTPYTINLPNLKILNLSYGEHWLSDVDKLIRACPSLEELYLTLKACRNGEYNLKCSNQNIRRLVLNLNQEINTRGKVMISAPKLEYLSVHSPKTVQFSFDMEPMFLREANIKIISPKEQPISIDDNKLSKLYRAICDVKVLSLDVFALSNLSEEFCNATSVTFNMTSSHNIKMVLSLVNFCPVIDSLTLKFSDIASSDEQCCVLPKSVDVNTLPRVIKRIDVEAYWKNHSMPTQSFLELIGFLLSNTVGLERFCLRVADDKASEKGNDCRKRRSELRFCMLLYQCPLVSQETEVEFVGKVLKMSRKAGPKVRDTNGNVINFHCSGWTGFHFSTEYLGF